MARKHKNARPRIYPRPIRFKIKKPTVKVYKYPKRYKDDIYPGRVAAVGWIDYTN